MRMLAVTCLLMLAAVPALGAECDFPEPPPQKTGAAPVRLVNACGQSYEVGYRLEGNILYFPDGGWHEIKAVDKVEAEHVLRETYGLVGPRSSLVRTRF